MPIFDIRPLTSTDHDWISQIMITEWGAEIAVAHGEIFYPASLPGFAAFIKSDHVGLLTYSIVRNDCEIVTLNSWRENIGVGAALIGASRESAIQAGCTRLRVVTTNNNLRALRFYQKRGFFITEVRENAIAKSRLLKPQIPFFDNDGRPISDEIELEMKLN
jgi:ribosomal protein S18 acetylase RimI-like enzyme